MARGSGGLLGKLVLVGLGVAIGNAMKQKKADSNGGSQTGDLKENLTKGLDSLNEQTGGMVDKVKPGISKALDKVKGVIDSQQQMMDKEKDMIDEVDETLQQDDGQSESSGSGSGNSSGSSNSATKSPSVSPDTDQPSAGIYGGSTEYSESLKKNLKDDSSNNNS